MHCCTLNDTERKLIRDTGGTISIAGYVESLMGRGIPPIQKAIDTGIRPSLSVDVETSVPNDFLPGCARLNNAVGAVATNMGPRNVDAVLIAGKVMKRNGQMVGLDFARLDRLGDEARDCVYATAREGQEHPGLNKQQ